MTTIKNILIGIIAFIIFVAPIGLAENIADHYTLKDCEVVEVTCCTAKAVDKRGNLWEFYVDHESELEEGDIVKITLKGNHTITKEDDEIKRVKIS